MVSLPIRAGHPLFGIKTFAITTATGDVEIVCTDGRVLNGNLPLEHESSTVTRTTFDVRSSTLCMSMAHGADFTFQIGTVFSAVDRPVIYLDQNHWIDLARVLSGYTRLEAEKASACRRLIDLARNRDVILPLSGAHIVETAKKGGRQRTDLARTMVELSAGWQMRSPLWVRAHELRTLFSSAHLTGGFGFSGEVFTLTPEAIWSDRLHDVHETAGDDDLPEELRGLVARLSWATALTEVLLDTDPEVSVPGLEAAEGWARSFQELADHMRSNPHAKAYLRDLTRTRFISDMPDDLAIAAAAGGLSPQQLEAWLKDDAERDFHLLPALGRIREIVHLRLANSDDKWERNDLNDLLHLGSAAGYADVLVGERKTCNYLRRAERDVPAGAQVFHRMVDAMPMIESKLADANRDG